jgi:hypothetical protein
MRGFNKPATSVVTLKRPTAVEDVFEEIHFEVQAVPAGFRSWLTAQFPAPTKYVKDRSGGQWVKDQDKFSEWDDLFGVLLLAKGLEPFDHLEHKIDWTQTRSAAQWKREALAVFEEMRAANLTQAEMMELLLGVVKAGTEAPSERGNSSARSEAG